MQEHVRTCNPAIDEQATGEQATSEQATAAAAAASAAAPVNPTIITTDQPTNENGGDGADASADHHRTTDDVVFANPANNLLRGGGSRLVHQKGRSCGRSMILFFDCFDLLTCGLTVLRAPMCCFLPYMQTFGPNGAFLGQVS